MTELAVIKVGFVAVAGIAFEAVIDPSVTSITLAVIAAAVVIIPLWFKYKTDTMLSKIKEHDVKIAEVIKTSDGMKDALVAATANASRAEGIQAGVTQAEVKAALITAAEAVGAAREAAKSKEESAVPASVSATSSLKSSIAAVPEKTAVKVVEKLKE